MYDLPLPDHHCYGPSPDPLLLAQWLGESNALTCSILKNLQAGQELVPQLDIVNPPYWEFGHLTWFHEFWVQRKGSDQSPSALQNADYWFNSSDIAHADRWSIAMPSIDALLEFNAQVVWRTQCLLKQALSAEDLYFIQLAIFHQDMHNEAFAYMWHTLGYAAPFERFGKKEVSPSTSPSNAYITFAETTVFAGSRPYSGFIFDNEKWEHPVAVPAFSIAQQAVSNAAYLAFLESDQNQSKINPLIPLGHWKKEGAVWMERTFDQWSPLIPHEPVRNIAYADAEQYCQWAGVRMPTEYELSLLLSQESQVWQASNLWEWTTSVFAPFPGFTADPYADYSQPWFDGSYQVLKGWSAYTPERMRRPALRNFYKPSRSDHFCGFRTCLL
ncbi:SUMF1/EgtB/PvdO family nonheme iron enzyme [Polynucleobacter brandtiae]|uniref:Ergothioneine biosynthesis protein EgtB n=1 Tax=Polynucleobacter brandtiae TaxID=1938816 RepID=A0A2M8VZR8_9BURK|nr:SUMF1/EgtB/PvdO family nonheme iron enzyme [Polynucleobacter brandtiae]PJI83348.1 ergothioneine biosynthesis protein EgtB [Polynucleobacter brandtiae]